jgi:N-methylhydantoinase B
MRKEISALPPGTYRFEDYLDNDGIVDEPLTIALDLTVSGDA